MAEDVITTTGIARHGGTRLPSVDVDSFNIELKDEEGFLGDRASKGAFRKMVDRWRKPLRKTGEDPFGDEPSDQIKYWSATTPRPRRSCIPRSRNSRRNWPM